MPEEKERQPDIDADDSAALARVKRMMEGPEEPEKPAKTAAPAEPTPDKATTAPELADAPVPKEPVKPNPDTPPTDTPKNLATKKEGPTPEDDPKTAKAVDDIVAHESDELLKAEDEKLAEAFRPAEKLTRWQKVKRFLHNWWGNPRARWITIGVILLLLAIIAVVPPSRYFVLNTAGVRASLSVQVLDESTFQPLKNVEVSAHGVSALTNTDGQAKLEKVKLGATELKIDKRAFAPITKKVTVGWGSNPQGEFQLTPVGAQYSFVVTDYLSGKGVAKIEAISGEASALSDENGKIKLTIDEPPDDIEVTIKGDDYREESFTISAATKDERAVSLVPGRKEVFVSKRDGKFDLYKIDIDGKNEERVLAGTGTEREDIALISHPKKEVVAMVSTREGKRNSDGYLLSTLTLVDLTNNSAKALVTSERIQLVDWVDDRLIYVQVAAGASAANPKRQRLMSYHHEDGTNNELATSNTFNDVLVAANKVYYAPSGAHQAGGASFLRANADGSARLAILSKEAWNLFRTTYDHITVAVPSEWYDYRLDDQKPTKLSGEPANLTSRIYVDSPDGKKSLWVDSRDGKGVLLVYDINGKEDKTLRTQSGLKNPLRWLSNHTIIYRIHTDQETADYALSLNGGDPRKIRDVTNTRGIDQWYHY